MLACIARTTEYHQLTHAISSAAVEPDSPADAPSTQVPLDLQSTAHLLARARAGHEEALAIVLRRCLPALRRWARGRLPAAARDLLETEDLVQETVLRVLSRLSTFEPRHAGALQAYLRQAILNRIRDEARRVRRRPTPVELADEYVDAGESPLERALGRERVEQYDAALQRLTPGQREAIVARIELQCSYQEIAVAMGKPSADAARVAVVRALYRLHEEMRRA